MKITELEKIISKAKVTEIPVIDGSDDDGEPIVSKKKSGLFRVEISELDTTVQVEAKSEAAARDAVVEHLKNTPASHRNFELEGDKTE